MATQRIAWDPRSEMAAEAVERMAILDWGIIRRDSMEVLQAGLDPHFDMAFMLDCGHWQYADNALLSTEKTAYCGRRDGSPTGNHGWQRVLKSVVL